MGFVTGTISGIGTATTFSLEYNVNPFTGKSIANTVSTTTSNTNYNFEESEYDPSVTLYRGTTGSEQDYTQPLFMTDDPNYAAQYTANGGKVVEVKIPLSTLRQMESQGLLNISPKPQLHINGTSGIEYEFSPMIKSIIVPLFK